ncbi:cytochrome P450 2J2 [Aplysia californica]|uniref:Cytochrome P450 2J2 n=1 Tax=Aplysia californica TaxID=6500 RepID=A0ABM0JC46_APLCA|nr:cytochrome P450 2J2 [Aplysia californica]
MLDCLFSSVSSTGVVLLLLVFLFTILWIFTPKNPGNIPPQVGISLPFLGHYHLLDHNPRKQCMRWAKQLGDIYSFYIGQRLVVVLASHEILKEALVKEAHAFGHRPVTPVGEKLGRTDVGLTLANGANWKEQRTVTVNILREMGMGKDLLADKISEEAEHFLKYVKEEVGGRTVDLDYPITLAISNIICNILKGSRFEYDDPFFKEIVRDMFENFKLLQAISPTRYFPILLLLPGDLWGSKRLFRNFVNVKELFANKYIKEIEAGTQPNANFIASYLKEMQSKMDRGQKTYQDKNQLLNIIIDLFNAGTETTSTTIKWALVYMLRNPEVQERVYREIEEHVGLEKRPTLQDRPKLKYLNVVIMETQRLASIGPFIVPHACRQDYTYRGYFIPKGSVVLPFLDSVLHDEKAWGDPMNFRPERFFDEEGNIVKPEEFIPFAVGSRACLGESIAKAELFLFLSAMIQEFRFLPDPISGPPGLEEKVGLTHHPVPFRLRAVPRNP